MIAVILEVAVPARPPPHVAAFAVDIVVPPDDGGSTRGEMLENKLCLTRMLRLGTRPQQRTD